MNEDELTVVEVTVPLSWHGSVVFFEGINLETDEVVTFAVDYRYAVELCDWLEEHAEGERWDDEPPVVTLESWQIRTREPLAI